MRLADQIVEATEDRTDPRRPDLLRFAAAIRQAVPFEIENHVGEAAFAIGYSDLKRLMEARRFAKAPFRMCWFEWLGPSIAFGPTPSQVAPDTYQPRRCGFLMETDESFQRGQIYWAWSLSQGVELSALAVRFDWTDSPQPIPDIHRVNFAIRGESWSSHARDVIYADHKADLGGLSAEIAVQEELRWGTVYSPYAQTVWPVLNQLAMQNPDLAAAKMKGIYNDIHGEGAFAQALLVCLNSRNLLSVSEPENLAKLNKARQKRGKQPLLAFSQVRLDLSRVAQRKTVAAAGHGGMRAHLVRGHFKIRKGGVFWWSPFVRGDMKSGLVQRLGYTLDASATTPPKAHSSDTSSRR